jgi:hypothetical protein
MITTIAAMLLLLAANWSSPAMAQGVGTGVVVDVDPGISLSCSDTITFDITAQQISQMIAGGGTGDQGFTSPATSTAVTGVGSSWDVTITGLQTPVQSYRMTQEALDICTVQAVGLRFGNYTVSVALTGNTWLDGPSGSRVRVTSVRTRPGYATGGYTDQFSVSWFALLFFLGGRFTVDFQLEFDFQQAARPGLHSSAVAGTFVVTAASP